MRRPRVLLVADDPSKVDQLRDACGARASRIDHAVHASGVLTSVARGVDFVIFDLGIRSTDGLEMLRELESEAPSFAPLILLGDRFAELRANALRGLGYRVLGTIVEPITASHLEIIFRTFGGGCVERKDAALTFSEEDCLRGMRAGEFFIAYQPQIRLDDGIACGVEALVRWAHPRCGVVLPASFVPTLESKGHSRALTRFVLGRALDDVARLRRAWPGMRLAVNISATELADPELADIVIEGLRRTGTAPRELCLEITESAVLPDDDTTMETLVRLRLLGVGLALDDFGTGYSTLAELRRLPLSEIKLDQSYVREMERSTDARAIVEGVMRIADGFNAHVVAEGVEDPEVCATLRRLGCETAQGYFFARPMAPEPLYAWLTQRTNAMIAHA